MARSIGDAPVLSEKFPRNKNAIRKTRIQMRNPVTRATRLIRKNPILSTFGGPSRSSVLTVTLSSLLFSIIEVIKDECHSTYRDKYIRKVQDCKIFYRDEVDNVSDEYAFIRMREGSCEDESISSVEKFGSFLILFMDILIDNSANKEDSKYLEDDSSNRE